MPNHQEDHLLLNWIETGLDTRPELTHEGFGYEMLLRNLPYDPGAETHIEFTEDGVRFTMRMPLGPVVLAE